MKNSLFLAAALTVLATPALYAAGTAAKPAPTTTPKVAPTPAPTASPAEVANYKQSAIILRGFNLIFEDKNVQLPVKNKLLTCLYNNKLSTISSATSKQFDGNAQLKRDDTATIYRVAAAVCGISIKPTTAAAPAADTAPAPTTGAKTDTR